MDKAPSNIQFTLERFSILATDLIYEPVDLVYGLHYKTYTIQKRLETFWQFNQFTWTVIFCI